MKKQMKLFLFALLVVLMVATMIVVASAATDGATIKEDGHFYEVVDKDGANATYYTKLQAAITAVTDGGKITVLADATEAAGTNLEREGVTYTITGGTGTGETATRKTITFTGGSTSTPMMYLGKTANDKKNNGSVTIENITFASAENWQCIIYCTGDQWAGSKNVGTLTLRNVRSEIGSMYGIWLHQACHLVIEGEDTYMKNEYVHADFDKGEQILRTNTGAGGSDITITAGTFIGDFYLQTTSTHTYSNCEITGYFFMGTYAHTVSWDNVTFKGYVRASVANNNITIKNSSMTFEGDATYGTYLISTGHAFKSFTITDTAINISGAGKKLCDSESYGGAISITGGAISVADGVYVPVASEYKAFAPASMTATGKLAFTLVNAGTYAIGTQAELVAAIKGDANYANLAISDAWHDIIMNNDNLKIKLSGDALAQQSGETPFITATAGTLIAIEKGVTTYVAGTHFFKTNIDGTDYYYATLADAIDEVVNDGVIYLVADAATDALTLDNGKTFAIDGDAGKYTLTVTPVLFKDLGNSTDYTALFHPCLGDFTFQNIKFALGGTTAPSVLIWMQNTTTDASLVKVTLDNVDLQVTSTFGLWLHGSATLTVKGENTVIKGGSNNTVRVQAGAKNSVITLENGNYAIGSNLIDIMSTGSTLTIKDGTYTTSATKGYGVYISSGATSTKVYIEGGTFNTAYQMVLMGSNCTASTMSVVTISGGTFNYINTSMTSDNSYMFNLRHNYNKMIFPAGGTAVVNAGANAKSIFCTNSSSANSVLEVLSGTFDGGRGWVFSNKKDTITLGGTVVFKDTNNTLSNPVGTAYVGAINFSGATTLNITGGTYSIHPENTLNVFVFSNNAGSIVNFEPASGSTITMTVPRLIKIHKGTVNVKGGTYTSNATNGSHFMHVRYSGATLNISGGTFIGNESCTALITSNEGASASLGTAAKTIDITGGTFDGGQQWVFCNSMMTMTISNATFKDTNNTLTGYGAFRIRTGEPSAQNADGTLNLAQEVSLVINSGSFTTNENSDIALFWMEEETLTINGGTFNANRIVAFHKNNMKEAATVNFNGGLCYVRGDKAIASANCYDESNVDIDVVTFNGGTFVIAGENSALIYGADSDFGAINLERITLYTTSKAPVLYGKLANNALFTYVAGSNQVTANGVGKYAGTVYNVYTMGAATDESLDVSNSDQTLEGASIWVSSNATVTGIRFYTVLSAEAQETIASLEGSELAFGTIIAPADYVAVAGAFTIEALEKLSVSGEKYVKIPAKYAIRDENGDGIPEAYSAALVNIKEKNFTRGFAAISYVEVDGAIFYGAYDFEKNVRSIRDVSKAILASGIFEDDQIEALTTFAGFKANESALVSTTWNAGKINANGAIESATGYVYSDVIHLEKAGTTLTVIDADGNFAGADTTVFSQWTAEGATADCADNYLATDAAVAYKYGNTTAYTYTSSFDNEYIRVSYAVNTTPAVYMQVTTAVGTLKSNQTRYDAYRINKLVNSTYDEALEGLHIVAIGDSYFDDPNVTPYTWIEQLAKKYNMTLDNYGISGSTIAADDRADLSTGETTRGSNPMINRVYGLEDQYNGKDDLIAIEQTPDESVDIVFFDGGRNDLTRGIQLGEQTLDNEDIATVCGAMNMIIANLRDLYPKAIIIGINPWAVNRSYALDYNGDGVVGIDEDEDGTISAAEKALETHTQLEYSTAVKAMFELNEVVCFDLTDKEATGVDMDSAAFREANCKGFADISHLNAYGAACFLPKIEAFAAEQYKAFIAG